MVYRSGSDPREGSWSAQVAAAVREWGRTRWKGRCRHLMEGTVPAPGGGDGAGTRWDGVTAREVTADRGGGR
jgi:hypothetical protein